VAAHPYIVGFLLMLWSYHPEKPIQAIRYTTWTFPKYCFATVRDWIQSKTEPKLYRPYTGELYFSSFFLYFVSERYYLFYLGLTTPSPYAYYTPTGVGCSLGCCNPTPSCPSPYAGPYAGPYASPYASPYATPNPSFYYPSSLPSYGTVPAFTSKAYELEKESGDGLGPWKMFGWGLWICGIVIMLAYGPTAM